MKLTNIAILALKGSDQGIKKVIAEATGVTPSTVYRWISDNENNGGLTKAIVVKIIREELGLEDSQILNLEEPAKLQS